MLCVRSLQPAAKICASASDSLSLYPSVIFSLVLVPLRWASASSMCAWLKDHAWWWWIRVFLLSLFFGLSFLSEWKMKISARKSTTNCGEGKVNDLGNDVALGDPDTSRSKEIWEEKKVNTNSPSAVSIAMHLPPTQSHMTLNAAAQRSPPLHLLRDCVYIYFYTTHRMMSTTNAILFFRNCSHCARAAAHDDHRRGAKGSEKQTRRRREKNKDEKFLASQYFFFKQKNLVFFLSDPEKPSQWLHSPIPLRSLSHFADFHKKK